MAPPSYSVEVTTSFQLFSSRGNHNQLDARSAPVPASGQDCCHQSAQRLGTESPDAYFNGEQPRLPTSTPAFFILYT